jgi:hypothetical protein
MQIGSTSPSFTPTVTAQQGALPPLPQTASTPHKDKDGDNDNSTAGSIDNATRRQVNVLA